MFAGFGEYLSEGLAVGIADTSALRQVKRATESLSGAVVDAYRTPELAVSAVGSAGGAGGDVNIHFTGTFLGDEDALERAVTNAMKSYSAKNGNGWLARL